MGPVTDGMVLFRYDAGEPYRAWAVVGADGSGVTRPLTPVRVWTAVAD